MIKWILILFGGIALVIVAFFAFFAFMVWNHERGYPRSVLPYDLQNTCVIAKKPFVLVKNERAYFGKKVFDFLPKPDGRTYVYAEYFPGTVLNQDGSEAYDLSDAIEVPAGARFIVRDGFQDRNMNGSTYYFQLDPEALTLDSSFFYSPFGMTLDETEDGGVKFYSDGEMARFPDNHLFEQACNSEG